MTVGSGLLAVELSLWAKEAKECPVCLVQWTPEVMASKDARVVNHFPRKLACADCLCKVGAKALRHELGFDA